MFHEAVAENRVAELPTLISNANKALEGRLKAETLCREEQDRRGDLIRFDDAMAIFRKFFVFLLTRLKRLPEDVAARCNPENPLHAFHILEAEVNSIISDASAMEPTLAEAKRAV